jgi:hypothetical protein
MAWEDAQAWCNFVLLRPDDLPGDAAIERPTLRPEAPPGRAGGDDAGRATWTATNRAAYRCVVATPRARIRVKQFLYDWAPPAFGHPALWKTEVRPFEADGRIGWLGADYRGRPAATLHAHRTMVELSLEAGDADDEEFESICRGLRPVAAEACRRIDATPLAALAYAHRHPDPVVTVPVGYFRHHRSSEQGGLHARLPANAPDGLPGANTAARLATRFPIDSVFLVGPADEPREVDWVLRAPGEPDTALRLLATRGEGPHGIADPPELDAQPCETSGCVVGAARVQCAWVDARHGPYEAVWTWHDETHMLLARPRPHTNRKWFAALLADAIG